MKREDLEWNLGYLLDDAARLMRRAFDARIRHLGLTRAQWFVLAQLYREDGYTQTNLAKLADMDRATLGKVVDRLQEKGLIERRPHPEDRRANLIYITKAFDRLVAPMRAESIRLYSDALRGLSVKQCEQFTTMLAKVRENLIGKAEIENDGVGGMGSLMPRMVGAREIT
jgi:MarR family transcriptional regulator for hemolysin